MSAIPEDIMEAAKKVCGDLWKMDPKFIDEDSTGVTLLCNAILAERERCAGIAEDHASTHDSRVADWIASAISNPKT